MDDVKHNYTKEHKNKFSKHLYPTEWVIRTMLGKYPELVFDKTSYSGGKILDMGFGDGRNFKLLENIGFEIYGVEITEEILDLVRDRIKNENLAVGNNRNIPFNDKYFDFILACSSFYYVDKGSSFQDNLKEYIRVLKNDGVLIANFPEINKNFICKHSINIGDNHIIIQNDPHNIRNGYIFRAFESKEEILNVFSPFFKNICIGYLYEEYFGYEMSGYIVVASKQ
jgi:ubiquinone/menaquinone biosynthesis C-methylase UbiE